MTLYRSHHLIGTRKRLHDANYHQFLMVRFRASAYQLGNVSVLLNLPFWRIRAGGFRLLFGDIKMNQNIVKYGLGATLFGLAGSAAAALPTEIGTAVATAQADGQELGYLLLGMAVVVGVIFWLKRKA